MKDRSFKQNGMHKKIVKIALTAILILLLCFTAAASDYDALAEVIADCMGNEPFVVRVAFGELLLNRLHSDAFPNSLFEAAREFGNGYIRDANDSDRRAAAAACRNLGFTGGAVYVIKWKHAENTPLAMRSGVRLYDWFFYI